MTRFTHLIDGYSRFRETEWHRERARWSQLADGQSPKVMIIACSDSRVEPAIIFDAKPGEIFVVRNVAALAPPFETSGGYHGVSAALEFAVTQLEVEEIVVMGHGLCGGCAAALTGQFEGAEHGEGHFIASWVTLLDDARESVLALHPELDAKAFVAMELDGGCRCRLPTCAPFRGSPNVKMPGSSRSTAVTFRSTTGVCMCSTRRKVSSAPSSSSIRKRF